MKRCRIRDCPWPATAGWDTCTAHRPRYVDGTPVEELAPPVPLGRQALLGALVIAGAVLLVLAALALVELERGGVHAFGVDAAGAP